MRATIAVLCFLLLTAQDFACAKDTASSRKAEPTAARHDTTVWVLRPSFKYDVLTFLNTLTGDPFYRKYYPAEFAHVDSLMTPEARWALGSLKRKVKDERGNIISAFLTLYFSASDAESLDEMLAVVDDSEAMRRNLQKTPYYSDGGWGLYSSVRLELRSILKFLQAVDFPRYWQEQICPREEAKIREIEPQLPRYNVIREDETMLGHPLASDTITVYMLYFSQPHGIKITGTRFLTDVAWPFSIVLRNSVHEMMHPPYDLAADGELRKTLQLLKDDPFLMEKVEHHNRSFGYNSFDGFLEEDVVQALEQLVNEKFGVAREARQRWKESDDGMHVFAVALYGVLKEKGIENLQDGFRSVLIREVRDGALRPGRIREAYERVYKE